MFGKYNDFSTNHETIRNRTLLRFDNRCSKCNSTYKLEVHHIDQDRNNNFDDNLDLLCTYCHKDFHLKDRFIKKGSVIKIDEINNELIVYIPSPAMKIKKWIKGQNLFFTFNERGNIEIQA